MERIGVTRNLDGACDDQATTAYGNPNHNNTIIFKILTTSFSLIVIMNITTTATLVKGWVELFYVKGSPPPLAFCEMKIFESKILNFKCKRVLPLIPRPFGE